MTAIEAVHQDLTGRSDASIGLRIELTDNSPGGKCVIGLTGDTRLVAKTAKRLSNADLLVVHIGSLYEYDIGKGNQPWHLGFSGVVQLPPSRSRKFKAGLGSVGGCLGMG